MWLVTIRCSWTFVIAGGNVREMQANLFESIPDPLPDELFETLVETRSFKLERVVLDAGGVHVSPVRPSGGRGHGDDDDQCWPRMRPTKPEVAFTNRVDRGGRN